jgi:hypothetical protein
MALSRKQKVLVIDTCSDCPHLIWFPDQQECREAGKRLRGRHGIPRWCPLESVREFVLSESPEVHKRRK